MFFKDCSETNNGFIYPNICRGAYEKQKNNISHLSNYFSTDGSVSGFLRAAPGGAGDAIAGSHGDARCHSAAGRSLYGGGAAPRYP